MNELLSDLTHIAEELTRLWQHSQRRELQDSIKHLWSAAYAVDRSWSGSCIGYHANVYYQDFEPPPPGQRFDVEWGITGGTFESPGNWIEHDPEHVEKVIYESAGIVDDAVFGEFNSTVGKGWGKQRLVMLSVLAALEKKAWTRRFPSSSKDGRRRNSVAHAVQVGGQAHARW